MSMRDLGGQLCLGARLVGTTLNKRILKATELCHSLCHRPCTRESKIKVVTTLVLPTALYDVEAPPPAERMFSKLATAIAKAIGPHSADTSNTMSFHTATPHALEPGCQILLRRLQLTRRIFAKHPWTIPVYQRIISAYEAKGILRAIANDIIVPHMEPCPPCGASARGKWTNQSHEVAGPVGLLITSLAEHCGCIRPDLTIAGPANLAFHLQFLPYQQLRPMVDAFAAECHAKFLATNRSAYKDMLSFDKDTHRAALSQLPPSTKALVLSAQTLTMSSAGKRHKFFGESSGRCPFCGDPCSGIVHEAWSCPAFKKEQEEEDAFLSVLGPDNVPMHTLLGLPEQLEASYSDQLIRYLPGRRPQSGSSPELCCDAILSNETQAFLAQLCANHSHTATSIAYMLKANAFVPPKLTLPPILAEPPALANAFSDGSVRHPTSIFSTATFGVVWPGRTEEERSEQ